MFGGRGRLNNSGLREGYWGRNLAGRGITGWIPLHDVNVVNGRMHFMTAATVGVCRRTGV